MSGAHDGGTAKAVLPLQTGASALRDMVASTIVGSALAWVSAGIFAGAIRGGLAAKSAPVAFFGTLVGIATASAAFSAWASGIASARAHRASDIELDAAGFTICGGRKHGFEVRFAELKASDCSLEAAVSGRFRSYMGQTLYRRAFYLKAAGDIHLVAETAESDEEASVTALVEAIEARIGGASPTLATRPDLVVVCASCGAPLQPTDAADASCAHCRHRTPIPAEVRARLRQADAERGAHEATDRAIAKLLAQPGAARINVSLAAASVLLAVAGVVGPSSLWVCGPAGPLAAAAFAAGAVCVVRALIERRRALRDLTLHFAARTDASGVSRCRSCLGGLPADDRVVARCVYCGAASVRGLDFGRRARAAEATERELSADVARRIARARRFWALAASALVIGAVMSVAVRREVVKMRRRPAAAAIHIDLSR